MINPETTEKSIKFRSGGKDILFSGTVQTYDTNDLDIIMQNITIKLKFIATDDKIPKMDKEVTHNTIKFTLYNFDNSIGTGTTSPIEIGNFSNRKLYMSIVVYSLSPAAIKTINYTFYLGDINA